MYKTVLGLLAGMSYPELYKKVELELQIFQTAAILEVNSFEIFFRLAWKTVLKCPCSLINSGSFWKERVEFENK